MLWWILHFYLTLRGYLDANFSSLNFHHSIFVTYHSSLKIPYPFRTITHLSLLNIFHIVCGPHTCHSVQLFFFFFLAPKLIEPSEKKKKKNRNPNSPNLVKEEGKKKKKKNKKQELKIEPSEREGKKEEEE